MSENPMTFAFKLTNRTFTGFGEATNEAILVSMGDFRRFCTNPNENIFRLLGPSKLLQLPDELLLEIALYIDGAERSQDLLHLALTCRRFRNIAHEAIVFNGIVMLHSVRGYLWFLFQYPGLIPKTSGRMHLHSSRSRTRSTMFDKYNESRLHNNLDQLQLFQEFSKAIKELCRPFGFAKWVQEMSQNEPYARNVSLMGLLLVQPQLQELTVSEVFIEDRVMFSALTAPGSFGPFHLSYGSAYESGNALFWFSPALTSVAARTRILKVVKGEAFREQKPFTYKRFKNLEQLTVPVANIAFATSSWPLTGPRLKLIPDPTYMLPTGLQVLRMFVQYAAWKISYTVQFSIRLMQEGTFKESLQCVQLYFDCTLEQFQNDLEHTYLSSVCRPMFENILAHSSSGRYSLLEYFEKQNVALELHFLKAQSTTRGLLDPSMSIKAQDDPCSYCRVCLAQAFSSSQIATDFIL